LAHTAFVWQKRWISRHELNKFGGGSEQRPFLLRSGNISSVDEKNVDVRARRVKVTDLRIAIDFEDGRSITVPRNGILVCFMQRRPSVPRWKSGTMHLLPE